MASPYPLPPGCIFREDFVNPTLAAQNGLVITGTPWVASGVRVRTGMQISVPSLVNFTPPSNGTTLVFDATVGGFNGTYRTAFLLSGTLARIYVGIDAATNRLFWQDGTLRFSSTFSTGRRLFAASASGSTISWYQDGAPLGTSIVVLNRGNPSKCFIGSTDVLDIGLFLDPLHSIRLYNYALSANEIAQDYRTIRGLSA